ncbi:hypothetical protein ACSQ67_001251 [Phaseolus vulgaris]
MRHIVVVLGSSPARHVGVTPQNVGIGVHLVEMILENGVRNSLLMALMPTVQKFRSEKNKVKVRRKLREPQFCFQTRSDVDVLDDGYKWRKYGQKVVKNSLHPSGLQIREALKLQLDAQRCLHEQLKSILPPTSDIPEAYTKGSTEEQVPGMLPGMVDGHGSQLLQRRQPINSSFCSHANKICFGLEFGAKDRHQTALYVGLENAKDKDVVNVRCSQNKSILE